MMPVSLDLSSNVLEQDSVDNNVTTQDSDDIGMPDDCFNDLDRNVSNHTQPILGVEIPVEIPAPDGLTERGITNWNRDKRLIPDWRDFPKQNRKCQGLKNLVKMLNSAVGYKPPNTTTNECNNCGVILHWINDCGITLRNGKFYYSVRCNGICLKDNVSIPVKVLVDSGERCHNPRCSRDATLSWLNNKRSYCSIECIDGYQEWYDEASIVSNAKVSTVRILFKTYLHDCSKGRGEILLLPFD
jgi:hypothetical protein